MAVSRKLLYMWTPPGKWYEDAISIPKSKLIHYQQRALRSTGKLNYIWEESAARARYVLRTDPAARSTSYRAAKRAERELRERLQPETSAAAQMELFGSYPFSGYIMSCISHYPDGKCKEFMATCDPLVCISKSPKKPSFAEEIYKVGPPGVKYLEPLPHMLSGDIMTCNKWKLSADQLIRCAQFEQTCQSPGAVCAGELSGDLWIKDLDLDKGAFTAKAKAAGFDVQEYADHVIENKEDYDMRTYRQAVLARTFAKIARGDYSGFVGRAPRSKKRKSAMAPLAGQITHCALWAFDQTRGVYSCLAQGPSCEGQKQCVKPVLSPGRQSDIKRHKRILKDSIAAREKLNIRVGELRARANRDFHGRLARIGVYVAKGDRVDTEDPAVKKIAAELLRGYQPKLDKFNYLLNAAQKHINKADRVLTPKPRKKRSMRACTGWKTVWSDYYNARVDRCATYKAACEAGVCLPQPTPRPALPEPSASAVKSLAELMAEEYKTPPGAKLIGKEIMERSGLRNYRTRPGEKPDERYNLYVPVTLRRKAGLSPDEMADEMNLPGGDDELYALIQKAYPHMHGRGGKAGAAVRKRQRELRADWHYWKDEAFDELQEELMKQL